MGVQFLKERLSTMKTVKEKLEFLLSMKFNRLQHWKNYEISSQIVYPKDKPENVELDYMIKWIELEIEKLKEMEKLTSGAEVPTSKKIEWKGSPALFGYLFTELIKKGYIEPELHNGEMSYQGTAKLFFNHFNVNNTTFENLKNEMNPGKCKLSDTKRAKFTIPNLSDLA